MAKALWRSLSFIIFYYLGVKEPLRYLCTILEISVWYWFHQVFLFLIDWLEYLFIHVCLLSASFDGSVFKAKPLVPDRQSSTPCSAIRSLDSLTAARMSLVVALVLIPGISNGDFVLFLKTIEKVSPPLLLMTTSSVFAILRTEARCCLASEYVYTLIIFYANSVNA